MRIPYTGPLPPPIIVPRYANTPAGARHALTRFLSATKESQGLPPSSPGHDSSKTVLLTGAGISVASGLADYRGTGGTYTLNRTYRPIYYNEFITNHEARKRYWARSFLGWTNLHRARPNAGHIAVKELGNIGLISSVITQSMSFSNRAPQVLPACQYVLELMKVANPIKLNRRRFLPLRSASRIAYDRAAWIPARAGLHPLS